MLRCVFGLLVVCCVVLLVVCGGAFKLSLGEPMLKAESSVRGGGMTPEEYQRDIVWRATSYVSQLTTYQDQLVAYENSLLEIESSLASLDEGSDERVSLEENMQTCLDRIMVLKALLGDRNLYEKARGILLRDIEQAEDVVARFEREGFSRRAGSLRFDVATMKAEVTILDIMNSHEKYIEVFNALMQDRLMEDQQ